MMAAWSWRGWKGHCPVCQIPEELNGYVIGQISFKNTNSQNDAPLLYTFLMLLSSFIPKNRNQNKEKKNQRMSQLYPFYFNYYCLLSLEYSDKIKNNIICIHWEIVLFLRGLFGKSNINVKNIEEKTTFLLLFCQGMMEGKHLFKNK